MTYLESTTSTNEVAKKLAREGAEEGTIVVAEEQVSGHGRLTRNFFSPFAKGIWFSLILRPKFLPMEAAKCTLMAGVGVCRAIRRMGLSDCGIKWPNDLLYHGKKMVGMITEMSASMEKIDYIIIGIGINTGTKKRNSRKRSGKTPLLLLMKVWKFPAKNCWRRCCSNWRKNIRSRRKRALIKCWKTGVNCL